MTEIEKYRCQRCGNRFEEKVLTDREQREAKRDNRPVFSVQCPQCGATGAELQRL
jgi:rubredoxin